MQRALKAGIGSAVILAIAACAPPPPPTPPVVIGPPPPAPAAVQAQWAMNERAGARVMKDAIRPPGHDGAIGAGITVTGTTYDFPGWMNNVDGAGNISGQISATDSEVVVADASHSLEPINGAFSVDGTILLRRSATGTLPIGAPGTGYNLIQKARASNLGGFWKVEIRGNGNGLGHVVCTLGDGRNVLTVESASRVDDGAWHSFGCRLNSGQFSAVVDGVGANADASILGSVNPVERFSTSVTIGKKPGSTDPYDSFSGWVDGINISAG
jgi:hypothetical protein